MQKMSTGQDATLGNYRTMAALFFGENSGAVKFLDQRIEDQGENEEVISDEKQMVRLLWSLCKGDNDGESKTAIT